MPHVHLKWKVRETEQQGRVNMGKCSPVFSGLPEPNYISVSEVARAGVDNTEKKRRKAKTIERDFYCLLSFSSALICLILDSSSSSSVVLCVNSFCQQVEISRYVWLITEEIDLLTHCSSDGHIEFGRLRQWGEVLEVKNDSIKLDEKKNNPIAICNMIFPFVGWKEKLIDVVRAPRSPESRKQLGALSRVGFPTIRPLSSRLPRKPSVQSVGGK